MYSEKLKKYLREFSVQDLKELLRQELLDLLIEWHPGQESLFGKSNLISYIEITRGLGIFKERKFRKKLLYRCIQPELEILKECLSPQEKREATNPEKIIEIVSNKVWGNNKVSNKLLDILEIFGSNDVEVEENNTSLEKVEVESQFYELLDYQFVVKTRILRDINSQIPLPRVLVHMPTGTGKTKTAMHTIIHHYIFNLQQKGLVIWVAHSTELLTQALETIKATWAHLGKGKLNIFKFWGNYNLNYEDDESFNGLMIAGMPKLISLMQNNRTTFDKLTRDCRLLIIDEAHKSIADQTQQTINLLMRQRGDSGKRALIGLTATPGREMQDSVENIRLRNMFENRLIGIDASLLNLINMDSFSIQNQPTEKDIISYLQSRKILARLKREKLEYGGGLSPEDIHQITIQLCNSGVEDFSSALLKKVGLNQKRNTAILNRLIQLDNEKKPTIVFSCSVEHGRLLSAALTSKGILNASVFSDTDPTERKKNISRFKDRNDPLNILINYEVLTTGFDATNIRCVFITRPTKSIVLYSQIIGRGLRGPLMGGNEECLLVDIADNLDQFSNESMAFSFFNNYWNH